MENFNSILKLLLILLYFKGSNENCYNLQYKTQKSEEKKIIPYTKYTMKVPVILAEKNIQFNLEPIYDFEEPVLEIKNVKEQAYLLESNIVMITNDYLVPAKGKLFIKGFVRKSIEYAALCEENKKYVIGTIKNLILNIPFQFTSMIEFDIQPIGRNNIFDEPIICDIGSQHIYETQIYDNTEKLEKNPFIDIFKRIDEKMNISLDIKILQKQYVN